MLPHVTLSDWILSVFIVTIAIWVLLAEFLPGRSDDPPDGDDGEHPLAVA